mgnify:CR=1 FL=1
MKTSLKWRTIIALVLMYVALLLNWQWIWGFFLLIWIVPDLKSGTTYFIEPISKKENPLVFWLIMISWGLMAIYSFILLYLRIAEILFAQIW